MAASIAKVTLIANVSPGPWIGQDWLQKKAAAFSFFTQACTPEDDFFKERQHVFEFARGLQMGSQDAKVLWDEMLDLDTYRKSGIYALALACLARQPWLWLRLAMSATLVVVADCCRSRDVIIGSSRCVELFCRGSDEVVIQLDVGRREG